MPQSKVAEQPGPEDESKNYSCFTCRQRKVKCDRRTPCSNCVKAEKQCSFIAPVRGKRRRKKAPREGLRAKLKRYEELLKLYGARIEASEDFNDSDSETTSQPDVEMGENFEPPVKSSNTSFGLEENKPKFISKEGTSRYFHRWALLSTLPNSFNFPSAPWSNLGDEFQHPEGGGLVESMEESNVRDDDLFFESHKCENLASLHPSFHVLPKLREIYVDRVDPLMKILHLPTFWSALTNGLQHPENLPKSLESMIFAFYLAVISALEEDECQNIFGTLKSVIFSRYRLATRQSLVNAEFLSTSSPMTLRAYAIFMVSYLVRILLFAELMNKMCVRKGYGCDTLFVLSAVAIRLACKMGLHRDGTSLGLSPFETEMRRRLWWHLVYVDFRTADVLGTKPSLDLSCGDAKMPLNVDDEDLRPDMVEIPPERKGITSITLCLIKFETIETLRKFSRICPGTMSWDVLSSPDITLAKKDSIISQIEDHLERKYLRYCDPSNPLHDFVSIMIRSALCKMKLFAHNPRQFADSPVKVPQSERDIVFSNAMKLLEYVTVMRGGHRGLEKYLWQIGTSYLWNAIFYMLIGIRHRKIGSEVDKSWQLIGAVFSQYPQIFEKSTGAVYIALGRWTLDVWDEYVAASKVKGLPKVSTPEYIDAIRRCRRPAMDSQSRIKDAAADSGPDTRNSFDYDKIPSPRYEGDLPEFENPESYDFVNLLSFEMDPNGWAQWDQLVAEQDSLVDGME